MNKKVLFLSITAVFLITAASAAANEPLTTELIENWGESMTAIQVWGDETGESMDEFSEDIDPMDFEAAFIAAAGHYPEVEEIILSHGFADASEWGSVGARIMYAYGAVQMEEESPGVREELQMQMQSIEQDPDIPDDQRAMMLEQMEQMIEMMERMFDAPEADITAVRENMAVLENTFQ
ncbi:MAG: hypothetical protein ACOCVC_01130 [Spirochaeta sp.]